MSREAKGFIARALSKHPGDRPTASAMLEQPLLTQARPQPSAPVPAAGRKAFSNQASGQDPAVPARSPLGAVASSGLTRCPGSANDLQALARHGLASRPVSGVSPPSRHAAAGAGSADFM